MNLDPSVHAVQRYMQLAQMMNKGFLLERESFFFRETDKYLGVVIYLVSQRACGQPEATQILWPTRHLPLRTVAAVIAY